MPRKSIRVIIRENRETLERLAQYPESDKQSGKSDKKKGGKTKNKKGGN